MGGRATLTRYEAAEYLGVSVDTLDRLRAAGRLTACQVSARLVKYRQADLDAYLDECRTSTSSRFEPRRIGTSSITKLADRDAVRLARQIAAKQNKSLRRSA